MFRGTGRLDSGHASVPLYRSGKCRAFTTYKCSRALTDLKIKIKARSHYVLTEQSSLCRFVDGDLKPLYGKRILRSYIYISVMGIGSLTCYDHALDNTVRIAFHHGTVHECTGIAFVTVTYYVFLIDILFENLCPLCTCRESSASAAAKR